MSMIILNQQLICKLQSEQRESDKESERQQGSGASGAGVNGAASENDVTSGITWENLNSCGGHTMQGTAANPATKSNTSE